MSRRLINRASASTARSSATITTTTTNTLPDYEPLAFPLNDSARRALGDLSNDRGTNKYEKHLGDAVRNLGTGVSDLHERLRIRRLRLINLREKREERGGDKTAEEESLEGHLAHLEAEAAKLTEQSEKAMREVIDRRVELEDEGAVLQHLYTSAATEHTGTERRAGQEDEDEDDDEMPPPPESILSTYRQRRSDKLAEYNQMGMRERYALNNDYASFKKLWHDAAVGEDGPPLPDASRWFRPDGQPVMTAAGATGTGGTADMADESDDDLEVARETISLKCPLTLRLMDEPYSNHKCKHTFEKEAILDYLSAQTEAMQCPQTGCSQV